MKVFKPLKKIFKKKYTATLFLFLSNGPSNTVFNLVHLNLIPLELIPNELGFIFIIFAFKFSRFRIFQTANFNASPSSLVKLCFVLKFGEDSDGLIEANVFNCSGQ